MRWFLLRLVVGLVLGGGVLWLCAISSAAGPAAPAGYTLNDVYDFIDKNTKPAAGDQEVKPPRPEAGDGKTIEDIMALLKARLPYAGRACALPATGQTKCYDFKGRVINRGSADYPGQDGFYQAGCSSAGRFTDNGDGTVTDKCTGLMWQKETAPDRYTWQQALKYCENLTLAGHSDWRLPNVRELQSIVDYRRRNPSIDPVFGAVPLSYWSASSCVAEPQYAWRVLFFIGSVLVNDKTEGGYSVRAVRSGS